MAYKVKVTKEIDEALENIEEYCIEHFQNYDYAQKVLNKIDILNFRVVLNNHL